METTFGRNIETKKLLSTTTTPTDSLSNNNNSKQIARVSPFNDNSLQMQQSIGTLNYEKLKLTNNNNNNLMTNSLLLDSTMLNNNNNNNNDKYRSLILNKKLMNNNNGNTTNSLRIQQQQQQQLLSTGQNNNGSFRSINNKLSLNNSKIIINEEGENGNIYSSIPQTQSQLHAVKSIKRYNLNGYLSDSECNNYIYNNNNRFNKYKTSNLIIKNTTNENNGNENQFGKPAMSLMNSHNGSSSNAKFREQLNAFYEYLERSGKYSRKYDDDTQSCINVKINRTSSSASSTTGNTNRVNKNMTKIMNQRQQQQQQHNDYVTINRAEDFNNCLYTPRLTPRKPQQQQSQQNGNYLTWKSFNCNPLPDFNKETAIINDNDNNQGHKITKSYRYNLSNQNLGIIHDEIDYESSDKENNFNYNNCLQPKCVSMSTPGTPLLSSCTLPRNRLINKPINPINEAQQPIGLTKTTEIEDNVKQGETVSSLENALLNMNEVLKNLTLNAKSKQNELEMLKKIVNSFDNDSVNTTTTTTTATETTTTTTNNSQDVTPVSPVLLNISPSSSLSSSFSNSSKQSSTASSSEISNTSSSNSSSSSAKSTSSTSTTAPIKLQSIDENETKTKTTTKSKFSFSFGKKLKIFLTSSDKNKQTKKNIDCEITVNTRINENKSCKLEDMKLELQNKLRELEMKNSSDYMLIQDLKNQINRHNLNNQQQKQ